jgi:hypothetical protein
MPISQTDIDALNQALSAGEKSVTINGKSITYRSVDEIIRARDDLQRQLSRSAPVVRPSRTLLYHGGRGL